MLSLSILLWKLYGWFKRLQPWATGDWQLHHDNTPTHASGLLQSFLAKHQIAQVTQPPYSPDLGPCDFWLFPKLKWPLKGQRFQTPQWYSGQYDGAVDGDWKNNMRFQGAYFEDVIVPCTMFPVSCIFFTKYLYFFSLCGWIPSGQTSYIHECLKSNRQFSF